jgi:DNA-binding SARP family transcriptional activator
LEFRVLGPLEVVMGGRGLALGGSRERALLARLVLSANRVLTSQTLAEDLWGDALPAGATQALQVYVSRLRKVLREGGLDHVLVTRPPGYVLRVDALAIDAVRFEALTARARDLSALGDHEAAAAALGDALALWRGPALADVVHAPFAAAERARLEEERLAALEHRIEADLACGRHGELIAELEALTRAQPFRERLWAQRMLALYRTGRQAEALRAYQELRYRLGEELGIEPSAALRRLETAMLRHEPEVEWHPPPERSLEAVPEAGVSAPAQEGTEAAAAPSRMPFVGREGEFLRLLRRLAEAASGRGGLVFLSGEPGIGKTRLAEELAGQASREGAQVLWGTCLGGEWMPPYTPFAEAIDAAVRRADPEEVRTDLGLGGAPLARLVPALRKVLPDLGEPVPLQPDEERIRLLDAVAQLLIARSQRAPLLLCLDDLHWADGGTVAMIAHLARFACRFPMLVVGTYRDVELVRTHPLAEALPTLRQGAGFEHIRLKGLSADAVHTLLATLAEHEVSEAAVAALATETAGNPFFLREVLTHLFEEGKIYRGPDGRWASDLAIRELGIPEGVREVIGRRISRLSKEAARLLGVASVFEGTFRFDVVAAVADLGEADALDALDEALAAQLLQPAGAPDAYAFSHALIRHTLSAELSPSRQVRLHRKVAEALEATYGEHPSPAQAGEIAAQYRRSAGLPGAERGVPPALQAAAHAEATGAHEEAAGLLRVALDLLPESDPCRPRLLGRLAVALAWARSFEEAVEVAGAAGEAIAAAEGPEPAAQYLAEVTYACGMAGSNPHAWVLARKGLTCGTRRDVAWARFISFDLERQAAEDREHPGIPLDTPERWEAARILQASDLDPLAPAPMMGVFACRAQVLTSSNLVVLIGQAGEYARSLPLLKVEAEAALCRGQFFRAARCWSFLAYCHVCLGCLEEARHALEQAQGLADRVGQPVSVALFGQEYLSRALDEGWEELAAVFEPLAASMIPALSWARGWIYAISVRIAARRGQEDAALRFLGLLVPWLERAPAWTIASPQMACDAAEALWLFQRLDHVDVVERALREKVVGPDFRGPMADGRLALARLSALQGRHDEALAWFVEARRVLGEQGARPLLAIADYDEALMYVRRGEPGDLARARPLLGAARKQFEAVGMTGWICRADELSRRCG